MQKPPEPSPVQPSPEPKAGAGGVASCGLQSMVVSGSLNRW